MSRRSVILSAGAQMRQNVLSIYQVYPHADAAEITRRMIFEIGETVSDLQSRQEAALLLYAAADAVTAKMPVEDFRLPAITLAPALAIAAPQKLPWQQISWAQRWGRVVGWLIRMVTDRFWIGFVFGLIARGQP
jgi:hypothetical protein